MIFLPTPAFMDCPTFLELGQLQNRKANERMSRTANCGGMCGHTWLDMVHNQCHTLTEYDCTYPLSHATLWLDMYISYATLWPDMVIYHMLHFDWICYMSLAIAWLDMVHVLCHTLAEYDTYPMSYFGWVMPSGYGTCPIVPCQTSAG